MIAVTVRRARAMRTARSTTCAAWRGIGDLGQVLAGDVLEERAQVDLLLEVAAQRHPLLLADEATTGAWSSLAS